MSSIRCMFGFHKWLPIKGTEHTERKSKWEIYDYADGVCERCELKHEIRKEIWY